ncbi:MAG: hypothetical protein ABI683_12865 [Ginsengibacter sp.]
MAGLKALLSQVNTSLDAHERLDTLVVIEDEWTVNNKLLTPTLRIKRREIEKKHAHLYDEWSQQKAVVVWQNTHASNASSV